MLGAAPKFLWHRLVKATAQVADECDGCRLGQFSVRMGLVDPHLDTDMRRGLFGQGAVFHGVETACQGGLDVTRAGVVTHDQVQ